MALLLRGDLPHPTAAQHQVAPITKSVIGSTDVREVRLLRGQSRSAGSAAEGASLSLRLVRFQLDFVYGGNYFLAE